jgi:hypothetical protein
MEKSNFSFWMLMDLSSENLTTKFNFRTMRSKQVSEQALQLTIDKKNRLIKDGLIDLENGEVVPNEIISFRLMIFTQYLQVGICHYSVGNKSEDGLESISKAFNIIESCWYDHVSVKNDDYLFDWYTELIWLLSLGNALNIPVEDFSCAVRAWDKSERKDWLVDYLIKGRIPERELTPTLLFPKPYGTVKRAVEMEDKREAAKLLKTYLDKEWYPGHSTTYWHKYHLSKRDVFFGYWSLETPVIAKLAGIDDTVFRDCLYYPKELYTW